VPLHGDVSYAQRITGEDIHNVKRKKEDSGRWKVDSDDREGSGERSCEILIDGALYFCNYGNMQVASSKKSTERVAKYADMLSAMGTEPRLRIMQLLLSAHPDGLVVSDLQSELDIPNSTLSHHLDKLKNEGLVKVRRESTFLRYTADTEALQELLQFLYAECCTRNKVVKPQDIVQLCK